MATYLPSVLKEKWADGVQFVGIKTGGNIIFQDTHIGLNKYIIELDITHSPTEPNPLLLLLTEE